MLRIILFSRILLSYFRSVLIRILLYYLIICNINYYLPLYVNKEMGHICYYFISSEFIYSYEERRDSLHGFQILLNIRHGNFNYGMASETNANQRKGKIKKKTMIYGIIFGESELLLFNVVNSKFCKANI